MKIFLNDFFHNTSLESVLANGFSGVQLHQAVIHPSRVHGVCFVWHFGMSSDVKSSSMFGNWRTSSKNTFGFDSI